MTSRSRRPRRWHRLPSSSRQLLAGPSEPSQSARSAANAASLRRGMRGRGRGGGVAARAAEPRRHRIAGAPLVSTRPRVGARPRADAGAGANSPRRRPSAVALRREDGSREEDRQLRCIGARSRPASRSRPRAKKTAARRRRSECPRAPRPLRGDRGAGERSPRRSTRGHRAGCARPARCILRSATSDGVASGRHRGDRSVPRRARSRLSCGCGAHRAHQVALRRAGHRVRVLHLRRALVLQRRHARAAGARARCSCARSSRWRASSSCASGAARRATAISRMGRGSCARRSASPARRTGCRSRERDRDSARRAGAGRASARDAAHRDHEERGVAAAMARGG